MISWRIKNILGRWSFWLGVFAPLGFVWALLEPAIYLGLDKYINPYKRYWWVIFIFGIFYSVLINWPRASVFTKIESLDTEISVKVGDIFDSKNPIIVAIPTTLDTKFDNERISPESIQGQYTAKYFKTPENLDKALSEVARQIKSTLNENEYSDFGNGVTQYRPGEVFKVKSSERTGYLVAFATFNPHGTAQLSNNDFKDALPRMWLGIKERGDIGTYDLPLIGSGFSRLDMKRYDILREIIKSYVAASAESRIADKVVIYVRPTDYEKWNFDLNSIGNLLHFICEEHSALLIDRAQRGTALSG